ncbi:N-(5'-phosphoribosyl)anthranilate isomerase [Anaerohalosphaera lusitana]|uniref:N-(5'-phosphoribosyl)anthranilate isomerase n=1 Tax=Anaerohalosphaera lusitana TaxID=1936003 RepID=A0A1U9NL77_9BACT|nr:phosphoribosylanthranilate isomerase [Anaerohalosphaera lusitana]AQT68585.1 N-(5'-phosphoribosyl)anthranilate isomerase [Anaerohalosphaera lusitana]
MALVKIKVCGITNVEDAMAAIDMGADLLGFNFYRESPRYLDAADALDIINKIPTFVDTAGVFVNPSMEELREIVELGFLNWVQLHGDEDPDFCDSLRYMNCRTIKAIRVKSQEDIKRAKDYYTDAVLFDAYHPNYYGGTGETFDWRLIDDLNRRVFLAGGLDPDNAEDAVSVGVYGIDVCSGIESSPGKKDLNEMKRFFDNIRHLVN